MGLRLVAKDEERLVFYRGAKVFHHTFAVLALGFPIGFSLLAYPEPNWVLPLALLPVACLAPLLLALNEYYEETYIFDKAAGELKVTKKRWLIGGSESFSERLEDIVSVDRVETKGEEGERLYELHVGLRSGKVLSLVKEGSEKRLPVELIRAFLLPCAVCYLNVNI